MNAPPIAVRLVIALLAAVFLASCVTTNDLRDLADKVDRAQTRTDEALAKNARGETTADELARELRATKEEFKAGVREIATNVEKRTEAVATAAGQAVTPLGAGGIAGALATVAGVVVHLARNRREEKLWGTPAEERQRAVAAAARGDPVT